MSYNKNVVIFFHLLLTFVMGALFDGEDCVLSNGLASPAKCINFNRCDYAKKLLKSQKIRPQTCGFNRQAPLVCCPVSDNRYKVKELKSDKKCKEYHSLRAAKTSIAHGKKAKPREFPHMAGLGYGSSKSNLSWLCGGSLISERFVLTAAHCTKTAQYGDPIMVRLGDLNINDTKDQAEPQDVEVTTVYVHPDYKPPSHYNDIAILKLKKSVSFGLFIRPACIHTKKSITNTQIQAIGWGVTDFHGDSSNHLLKVFLNIIEYTSCAKIYSNVSGRKLPRGIDDESQICAGDSTGKDTCPGDSGGPLHFLKSGNADVFDHFVVVGITSFGKGCGTENSAGVYTRVSMYRSWIEDIAWPRKKTMWNIHGRT